MKRRTFDDRDDAPLAIADSRDVTQCAAPGCPCRASVSIAGGKWLCSAHAFGPADRWASITAGLGEHAWLRDFMTDLKAERMARDAEWRTYATRFWQGVDDRMLPHPKEHLDPYLYRLHLELLHRVGARIKPADVRLPAAPAVRRFGNVGQAMEGAAQ